MNQSHFGRFALKAMSVGLIGLAGLTASACGDTSTWRSHPPLRVAPASQPRPLAKGPSYFVDPSKGDDAAKGTAQNPWKTLAHSLAQLKAGDTLYLRGGTYFEQMYVSLTGKPDAPITIRSYPGEQALVNGGIREFFEAPEQAWEPVPGGAAGEFRSVRAYPNIRDVVGAFGDSFVGLQTYWHRMDLTATNQLWTAAGKEALDPVYCGPGIWYDRETGRIHARLSHTHLDWPGMPNYKGETDPRQLPLVIAPFRSVPLRVDNARHVRFQDLTICGGGYDTVVIETSEGVEFDNVTVWCGTYGLMVRGTAGFRFHNSALYGIIPPWGSRQENSLRSRKGGRDVARLTGHALLVADGFDEFSVFAFPQNRDWEISHSEFTDSHDGVYLGGVENVKFHHNLVDNLQDDGIYLSAVYPYAPQEIHIYQNEIRRCLSALAFGGMHPPGGPVFVYRNVFDLSGAVNSSRPSVKEPRPKPSYGKLMGDHGSPAWPPLYFYQNTCIQSGKQNRYWAISATSKERPRRLFNNIFYHFNSLPKFVPTPASDSDLQTDGNLFWLQGDESAGKQDFRKSKLFSEIKGMNSAGWEAHSLVADPKLLKTEPSQVDYRLGYGSPAAGNGVKIPADWPDPLRPAAGQKLDIGALPAGAEPLQAGRIRK